MFLPGKQHLRWSRLKNESAEDMYATVSDEVFPFLRTLGADGSTYAGHMKDARFTIPTPALLSRVVDMLDGIDLDYRDTNGDLYEYMLSKIATAGTNGQFRTPRHIIQLMVDMMAPTPDDEICDPACGTAGFLVAASEYVRDHHPTALTDAGQRQHFHHSMFHGYDFDSTMLRIGSRNMLLHGIESPDIRYRDSLSEGASSETETYTLVLANPPSSGSLDYESTSKDLLKVAKTKKTELLFVALFLKLLRTGGRAAVIVPDGVLFSSTKAHKDLRTVEDAEAAKSPEEQILDGVERLHREIAAELLTRLYALTPEVFEQAVLDLIVAMGYGGTQGKATRTQLSNDGGIDGIIDQDALGLSRVYIQAKRYALDGSVGRPEIQAFVGALHGQQANQGVFITTARFSSGAQAYAEAVPSRIVLIDGRRLAALMIRFGVGVQVKQTVQIVEIDEDAFE